MFEGAQPGRYCGNCGAETRPGLSFCVSCGTPVTSVAEGPSPSSSGSDSPGSSGSLLDDLRRSLWQSVDGLRGSFSGFGTDGIRGLPRRTLGWFRDLSGIPKLVLVGLVALVLLVLLSPVAMVVAVLLFGVSIIALIVRLAQKESIRNWGLVAVGSVILVCAFGFMSNALYGIGFMGGGEPSGGDTGVATDVAYDVVSEDVGTNGDSQFYNVVSSSDDLESLNLVAQKIQQGRLQRNSGIITFYESRADVPGGDPVGAAVVYLDEMQVRSEYSDNDISPPLSSEEVEHVVNVLADNGYVYTYVLPGGEGIPVLPDFMTEDRN